MKNLHKVSLDRSFRSAAAAILRRAFYWPILVRPPVRAKLRSISQQLRFGLNFTTKNRMKEIN